MRDRETKDSTNEHEGEGGDLEWLACVWENQWKSCLLSLKMIQWIFMKLGLFGY